MKTFEKEDIDDILRKASTPGLFENCEFIRCNIQDGSFGLTELVKNRTTVRNVNLIKCATRITWIGPVIFENVLVDTAKHRRIRLRAAVFKHVTLKGKLGDLAFFGQTDLSKPDPEFLKANAKYYESVDWALDISQAQAHALQFFHFPVHLVRRNPEFQAIVKAEKVQDERYKKLPFAYGGVALAIGDMLDCKYSATIVSTSPTNKYFKESLKDIKLLRKEGIAEPD